MLPNSSTRFNLTRLLERIMNTLKLAAQQTWAIYKTQPLYWMGDILCLAAVVAWLYFR